MGEGGFGDLTSVILSRGLIAIFITTFVMVFVLFTMIEPYISCEHPPDAIMPSCTVSVFSWEFILGMAIFGVLFLLDMGLVYYMLNDLLLPG